MAEQKMLTTWDGFTIHAEKADTDVNGESLTLGFDEDGKIVTIGGKEIAGTGGSGLVPPEHSSLLGGDAGTYGWLSLSSGMYNVPDDTNVTVNGKNYSIARFGTRLWMTEYLADTSITYKYNENNEIYYYNSSDVTAIIPSGWRLPNSDDIESLGDARNLLTNDFNAVLTGHWYTNGGAINGFYDVGSKQELAMSGGSYYYAFATSNNTTFTMSNSIYPYYTPVRLVMDA